MSTEQLVQGGGILIALAVVTILSWIIRWLTQHLDKTDRTNRELVESIRKNTQVTSELVTYFKALNGKVTPNK